MSNPKNKNEDKKLWDNLSGKINWHIARADTNGNCTLAESYRLQCNALKKKWNL